MNPKPLDSHRERLKAIVGDPRELAVTSSQLLRGCRGGSAFTWPQKPLSELEKDTAVGLTCCSNPEIKLSTCHGVAYCNLGRQSQGLNELATKAGWKNG